MSTVLASGRSTPRMFQFAITQIQARISWNELVHGREAAQEFTDRGSNRPPLVATSFASSATAETPRPEHRRALSAFSLSSMDNTVDSVGHPDDS
jgi:hypothetical protein